MYPQHTAFQVRVQHQPTTVRVNHDYCLLTGGSRGRGRERKTRRGSGLCFLNEINPGDNSHGSISAICKSDEGVMCPVYMLLSR